MVPDPGVPMVPAPRPGALAPAAHRPGDAYLTHAEWLTLAILTLALLYVAAAS